MKRTRLISTNTATSRLHRHVVGKPFRSRRILMVSPAQYRHAHMGKQR